VTVAIGNMPAGYRSDESMSFDDETLVDSILLALGPLDGIATTFQIADALGSEHRALDTILATMRDRGLLKYEVDKGNPDGITWRRSSAGIKRAENVAGRLARRR